MKKLKKHIKLEMLLRNDTFLFSVEKKGNIISIFSTNKSKMIEILNTIYDNLQIVDFSNNVILLDV